MAGLIYARAFVAIMMHWCRLSFKTALIYNAFLAVVLFGKSYFFYVEKIDWANINAGLETLTLWQKFIISDVFHWALFPIFLLGALVMCHMKRIGPTST